MPAPFYVNGVPVIDRGPDVSVAGGSFGQGAVHIDLSNGPGRRQQPLRGVAYLSADLPEKATLHLGDAALGIQDKRLVLLQLRRKVALGIRQGLLANVVLRHLAEVGIGNLDVVAKDLVVAYL